MSFKDDDGGESHIQYYLPTVELKGYVTIDGRNFFDQPIKNDLKTYDNIIKIPTGRGDYLYFKEHYKLSAIDLSKLQKLDVDPKAIQQTNFAETPEKNASIFFIIEYMKERVLDFSNRTVKISWFYFVVIKY